MADTDTTAGFDDNSQVRTIADILASPLSIGESTASFIVRGPWKKRLPKLLVELERAQEDGQNLFRGI